MKHLVRELKLYFQSRWHILLVQRIQNKHSWHQLYQSYTNDGRSFISNEQGNNLSASMGKAEVQLMRNGIHTPVSNPNLNHDSTPGGDGSSDGGLQSHLAADGRHTVYSVDENSADNHKHSNSNKGRYTLQDRQWVTKCVQKLKKYINLKDPDVTVVECNPAGTLTRSLLMRNKAHIIGLNYHKQFTPSLQTLQQNRHFKKRLTVTRGNILNIAAILKDLKSGNGCDRMNGSTPFTSECSVSIIGTTYPASLYPHYINLLTEDLACWEHVYSLGRVQSFFFVPPAELQIMGYKVSADKLFNRGSIRSAFYKVFFDCKVLLKVPIEAFGINSRKQGHVEDPNIYLIRVVPRSDIYTEIASQNNIPGLILLLKELRRCRGRTVMNVIESFCPRVLPLLKEGCFTELDNVSDLTVKEVFVLHKILLTQPDCLTYRQDLEVEDMSEYSHSITSPSIHQYKDGL